jgi:hypothetical protein
MTLSIYTASVAMLTRKLTALLAIMDKAEAYAAERKFDANVFVEERLTPDMNPFKFQITSVSDHAKFIAARLSGKTPPVWPDDEKTFADLKARVQKAIDYLGTFTPADLEGGATRPVVTRIRGEEKTITGEDYFINRALPNFYFHLTTAYALLRRGGVPVGKGDFLA